MAGNEETAVASTKSRRIDQYGAVHIVAFPLSDAARAALHEVDTTPIQRATEGAYVATMCNRNCRDCGDDPGVAAQRQSVCCKPKRFHLESKQSFLVLNADKMQIVSCGCHMEPRAVRFR